MKIPPEKTDLQVDLTKSCKKVTKSKRFTKRFGLKQFLPCGDHCADLALPNFLNLRRQTVDEINLLDRFELKVSKFELRRH